MRRLPFKALLLLSLAGFAAGATAHAWPEEQEATTRIVAGSPDDFMQVRYVHLGGSSFEIGRELARMADEQQGSRPRSSADVRRTAAQRRYFEKNYPAHAERMKGAAAHFRLDYPDDAHELASLSFGNVQPGCSVVYYPPGTTQSGGGVLSRNFDFTTGTFAGKLPGKGEVAVCSSPYVVEMEPDDGYASLSICSYDLLGGVVDGINSEGLTVALLADGELIQRGMSYPTTGAQAGLNVLQVGRFLLDTCADVEEAQAALLEAKLYYQEIPCHYIVADRHGRSFVWENTPAMSVGQIFEGDDQPLVTTNFMRHLHSDLDDLPSERHPSGSFNRYRTLLSRFEEHGAPVDLDFIKASNACVAATGTAPPRPFAPGRTLWHSLYFPEERRMDVSFYLGEEDGVERRSGYLSFDLTSSTPDRTPRVGAR